MSGWRPVLKKHFWESAEEPVEEKEQGKKSKGGELKKEYAKAAQERELRFGEEDRVEKEHVRLVSLEFMFVKKWMSLTDVYGSSV